VRAKDALALALQQLQEFSVANAALLADPLGQPESAQAVLVQFAAVAAAETRGLVAALRRKHPRGFSLSELADHDNVAWLDGLQAQGLGKLLLPFLRQLVRTLHTADAGKVDETGKGAERRSALCIVTVLNALLDQADPRYQSELGWTASICLSALTGSALALNLISKLVPGFPAATTLAAFKARIVASLASAGEAIPGGFDVLVAYDGVGARHAGRSRIQKAQQNTSSGTAVTSIASFALEPPRAETEAPMLQALSEHAPFSHLSRCTLPENFLSPRGEPAHGAACSERSVLDAERRRSLAAGLSLALSQCSRAPDGVWSAPELEASDGTAAAAGEDRPAAAPKELVKPCDACGPPVRMHGAHARTCDWCGALLPPMPAVHQRAAAARSAALAVGAAAASRPLSRRIFHYNDRFSSETWEHGRLVASPAPSVGGMAAAPEDNSLVTVTQRVHVALPVEPTSTYAIEQILTHIGKISGVVGFGGSDERQWIYVVSDNGAYRPGILSKGAFQRLHHVMGTGHEFAVAMRMLHHLMLSAGMSGLISSVYRGRAGQIGYLTRASDVHQVRDWLLDVFSPSLMEAFALEYVLGSAGEKTTDGFAAFLAAPANRADSRFAFFADIVVEVLPGLHAMHLGIRACDATSYSAGRKVMLVLGSKRGLSNYVPYTTSDIATLDFLCSDQVRRQREMFLSYRGQGYDYLLEEVNRHLQMTSPGHSFESWFFASAMHDSVISSRAALFKNLGLEDRAADGYHAPLDLTADRLACRAYLWQNRSVQPGGADLPFRGLAGEALTQGCESLWAQGLAEVALIATAYREEKKYVVRAATPLSRKEETSGVAASDGFRTNLSLTKDKLSELTADLEAMQATVERMEVEALAHSEAAG